VTWSALFLRVATAVAVVAAGWIGGGFVRGLARVGLEGTPVDPRVRLSLLGLVRPVVVGVAAVMALEVLDVDLSTVAAMAGATTLAVGFALQPALSNLAAGALLTTLRPYREGDLVECATGERGRVLDQGPFAVVLERSDGVVVTVPNQATFVAPVRNLSRLGRRRVDVELVLDADTSVELARSVVVDRLLADGRVLRDPPPSLAVVAADERGLRVVARAWVHPDHHEAAHPALTEEVLGILRVSGVSLAQRRLP
jgi:small conductance mechanosensitive channel